MTVKEKQAIAACILDILDMLENMSNPTYVPNTKKINEKIRECRERMLSISKNLVGQKERKIK
jgi:hypothetical protein